MKNKKYTFFISSTYADLVEQRDLVARRILDAGHIPVGMERFPAFDEEQMSYIRKVIDDAD